MVTKSSNWVIWALQFALCLLALPGFALSLPHVSKLETRQQAIPKEVLRGDAATPDRVKAQGGFVPNYGGKTPNNESFELYHHQTGAKPTQYVSTTITFKIALKFGAISSKSDGYIYKIKSTPNMLDLQGSLADNAPSQHEDEFSALGGVRWDQIIGWMATPKIDWDSSPEGPNWVDPEAIETEEAYVKARPNSKWVANPDYNAKKYGSLMATGPQPQLVTRSYRKVSLPNASDRISYEQHAIEFMKANGQAVGFDGKFPLPGLKYISPNSWKPDAGKTPKPADQAAGQTPKKPAQETPKQPAVKPEAAKPSAPKPSKNNPFAAVIPSEWTRLDSC